MGKALPLGPDSAFAVDAVTTTLMPTTRFIVIGAFGMYTFTSRSSFHASRLISGSRLRRHCIVLQPLLHPPSCSLLDISSRQLKRSRPSQGLAAGCVY